MAFSDFIKGIFKAEKKESAKSTSPSLVDQIRTQMELLVEKSGNFNDLYSVEKRQIIQLSGEASLMEESNEILAAKLEQDILGRITAVSSACDLALSGTRGDGVKKEIANLSAKISQRCALR